jgi:hypothetical protein
MFLLARPLASSLLNAPITRQPSHARRRLSATRPVAFQRREGNNHPQNNNPHAPPHTRNHHLPMETSPENVAEFLGRGGKPKARHVEGTPRVPDPTHVPPPFAVVEPRPAPPESIREQGYETKMFKTEKGDIQVRLYRAHDSPYGLICVGGVGGGFDTPGESRA